VDAADLAPLLPAEAPGLLRFARRLTRTTADAEDLVQDTLTRAIERAHIFRGESSLATWLHRIEHHLAVDGARRDREVPVDDVATATDVEQRWSQDEYTVDAEALVTRAQTREELEDALVHLPLVYRTAVVLHDAEGLTVPELARIQGVSLAAAQQRVRRGRMMLVSELSRDTNGGTPCAGSVAVLGRSQSGQRVPGRRTGPARGRLPAAPPRGLPHLPAPAHGAGRHPGRAAPEWPCRARPRLGDPTDDRQPTRRAGRGREPIPTRPETARRVAARGGRNVMQSSSGWGSARATVTTWQPRL